MADLNALVLPTEARGSPLEEVLVSIKQTIQLLGGEGWVAQARDGAI